MRLEIRTLTKAISTLALLFVLVVGASLDVAAQRRGRSHNRGNHFGWTRGRRVGQQRQNNNWRWRRRELRRDRRHDRRVERRDRRDDRRNNWRNRHDR